MNTTETQSGSSLQRVVSVLFGELNLSGCENHPHRLDLSCCKIRKTDGTALTTKQVWEVLSELSSAKHANDKAEALSLSEVDPPAAGSATVAQDSRI